MKYISVHKKKQILGKIVEARHTPRSGESIEEVCANVLVMFKVSRAISFTTNIVSNACIIFMSIECIKYRWWRTLLGRFL